MTTDQIRELIEKYTTDGVIIKGVPGMTLLSGAFDGWYFEFLVTSPNIKRRAAKVKADALDSLESFFIRELSELKKQE